MWNSKFTDVVQGHTDLLATKELKSNLSTLYSVICSLKEYEKPKMQVITVKIGIVSKLVVTGNFRKHLLVKG